MLITQYILNLENRNFTYTGSGTIIISGSASVNFLPLYGQYQSQFYLGEYVYDYSHNVWQIVAIQGTVENPIYIANRQNTTQQFLSTELVKFADESTVFNNILNNKVSNYQQTLNKLNNIVITPPYVAPVNNVNAAYNVGEYVFDLDQNVWQISSIQGSIDGPLYTINRLDQQKDVIENEIVKFNNQTSVFNNIYNKEIAYYQQSIEKLDNIVITPTTPQTNKIFAKFNLGESVFDFDQNVWQIVAIQGSATTPVYVCTRMGQQKEFQQNDLVKFNNQSTIFNQIYDAKVAKYQDIISKLNSL